MSSNDALQRAKEIAARLQRKSNFSDGPSAAPEPKRQRRAASAAPPPGAAARRPRATSQRRAVSAAARLSAAAQMAMEAERQCKIIIRGQGSNREGTARSFRNEPHEDDELPLHVSIEGPSARRSEEKEVVAAAPRAGETTYEARVPNGMVGLVIGKGGETIKRLQYECGVRVQIAGPRPKDPTRRAADEHNPNARTITIAADTQYAVRGAAIEQLLASELGAAGGLADDPSSGPRRPTPCPGCVGLIIGKGGETISRLQQATARGSKFPASGQAADPPMRYIMIGGLPDARTRAQYEIAALVGQHETRNPGMGSAMVDPYAQTADPSPRTRCGTAPPAPAALAPDARYQDFGTTSAGLRPAVVGRRERRLDGEQPELELQRSRAA
ncbi:hypothetical protein JL720_12840 [Aureococcus anophagefferens]|nr:hypothetical protein JL720_12840 [Aureococcus anophagefferens]